LKILFVDDSQDNIDLLEIYMTTSSDEAFYSLSGKDTLDLLQNEKFDLYFIDISMPEMDGHELLGEIKKLNISSDKFFALTAHNSISEKEKILNSGFQDVLVKPLTKKSLLEFIESKK